MNIKKILIFALLLFPAIAIADSNSAFYEYNSGQYLKALSSLKSLSAGNNKRALFYLGMLYINGYGESRNLNHGIQLLSRSGEHGYMPAQMFIGKFYLQKKGDPEKAFFWFKKAADLGNTDAQMFCSAAYLYGYGVKRNPEKARRYFINAAKNGNPTAQYTLAIHFLNSKHSKNRKLGLIWLKKSARNNNMDARQRLASMYCSGNYVVQDGAEGLKWLQGVESEGNTKNAILLGKCYRVLGGPVNMAKAIQWYQEAAKAGDQEAQLQLGLMYLSPEWGVQDVKEGYLWILKAAQDGSTDAQQQLAKMYEEGVGVEKDASIAEQWRLKAQQSQAKSAKAKSAADKQKLAMQWLTNGKYSDVNIPRYSLNGTIWDWKNEGVRKNGAYNLSPKLVFINRSQIFNSDFTLAQPNEVQMARIIKTISTLSYREKKPEMLIPRYQFPEGVDHKKRFKQLSSQAMYGNEKLQFELGQMHELGLSITKDINQAMHWYIKAANQKHLRAEYNLGLLYLEGNGVEKDYKKAMIWLKKAAFRGSPYAQYVLGVIYENGLGEEGNSNYVSKNIKAAAAMYNLAASGGYGNAQFNLAELYSGGLLKKAETIQAQREQSTLIIGLYQEAADGGIKQAMLPLAYYYASQSPVACHGDKAMGDCQGGEAQLSPLDRARGSKPRATSKLGYAEHKEDSEKQEWAFDVVRRAAKGGNRFAAFFLGLMYDRGLGVSTDKSDAIYWYRKGDLDDNPVAQFILGTYYYLGEGVSQDRQKGVELLTKAAQQDVPFAAYNLAVINHEHSENADFLRWLRQAASQNYSKASLLLANYYLLNSSGSERVKTAADIYRRLARIGYSNAQLGLGYLFAHGIYVTRDYKEAVDLYTKSAQQGNVMAAYLLGRLYQTGKLGGRASEEAKAWFRKAADQGFVPAMVAFGYVLENRDHNYKEALAWYQKAADENNPQGQFDLALMYQYGKGVDVDSDKANVLYKAAASQEFAPAQYALGNLYLYRSGRNSDSRKAFELFQEAAGNGDLHALYQLALLGETGVGTPVNLQNALTYYTQAARRGHLGALLALARYYDAGIAVEMDKREAFKFYQRAAAKGNAFAQFRLARMYQMGAGVTENQAKAKALYKRSASNGNTLAVTQLKRVKFDVPKKLNLMYMNAINELNEGNVQVSEVLLKRIVKQYPKFLPAQKSLEYVTGSPASTPPA